MNEGEGGIEDRYEKYIGREVTREGERKERRRRNEGIEGISTEGKREGS